MNRREFFAQTIGALVIAAVPSPVSIDQSALNAYLTLEECDAYVHGVIRREPISFQINFEPRL